MREKLCGIYKLTNKIDGKIYIGQTVDYHRRMNEYANRKAENSSKYNIMSAVNKYGFDNFDSELIFKCDKSELDYYEMFFIKKYKSYMKKYGYNSFHIKSSGKQGLNRSTKSKMKKSHIGLTESADTKRKKSNKIIAIKDHDFYIFDSAKLFGDFIEKGKDIVKNALRGPVRLNGFWLFYENIEKRNEMADKVKSSGKITDSKKEYLDLVNYLSRKSVETIEDNEYLIRFVKYL